MHDRESFFKYMPASTAKLVLTNRTLRWSSPTLFNDPFDVPRELSYGLKPRDMVEACARQIASFIEDPPAETSHLSPKLQLIVEAVKRGIPDELRAELLEGIRDTAESMQPTGAPMEEMRTLWRSWIPDFRILCLTESPKHVAMWMHYANRYTGAVLEFRCVRELDSPWLIAQPVQYTDSAPAIYTADGWATILAMEQQRAIRRILDVAAFTKSTDWSYEREWRITTFKRHGDKGNYTDYQFHAEELGAIYLGPLIEDADKAELLASMASYPNARIIQVSIGMAREFILKNLR